MACCAESARPSIPHGTTEEQDFPAILLYVDDGTPATLAPGQKEPSRSGWEEDELWSSHAAPGWGHDMAIAPGPFSWHDGANGWHAVASTPPSPAPAPPLAPPPPPAPVHRAVRWESNEERLERARAEYRAKVEACPRRGLTTRVPNPMVHNGFVLRWECVLGDPCPECKAHPASLWYQLGERWFDFRDERSDSPEHELRPGRHFFFLPRQSLTPDLLGLSALSLDPVSFIDPPPF